MSLTLRIRAIDEAGAPVSNARVRCSEEDAAVEVTGADGIATVAIDTGFAAVTVSHAMPAEARLALFIGEGSSGVLDRTVILRRGAPLAGTVEAPDGTPLPAAMLEVWCEDGTLYCESNDAGHWNVPAMRAGPYEVRAGAAGYARGRAIAGTHDGRTAQTGVVVRVAIGARLHGRVCDATGAPVVGATIFTELQPGDDRHATTDADGRFEIVGLGAGRHAISVGHRWSSSVVMPGDGGQLELDVELPDRQPAPGCAFDGTAEPPTATLTGRVVRDGAPVSRFAIMRKGVGDAARITAEDGRFTLTERHAWAGSLRVLALGSAWASREVVVEPGAIVDLGDIVLEPGRRIEGTVCTAAGEPIGGARIAIDDSVRDDDPLGHAVQGHYVTTSSEDGVFVFDGVQLASPARLAASHPVHGASREHAFAGADESIRLVLVPTGSIDGVVEPYSAGHGAVIARADAREAGSRVASIRPSGRFTVENLIPGDYTLELVERPRWPKRFARATVVAGERTAVRMPLP